MKKMKLKIGCAWAIKQNIGVLHLKAQAIKKVAYGFRGRESFKAEIYFQCGR